MLGINNMVIAWQAIYSHLPLPLRSLISISVAALFLVVLFQTINHIRS